LIVHLVRPYYFTPLSVPDASIQEYGLPGSDWYVTDRLRNLPGGHATGSSPDEWCKTTTAPIVLIG